ncbi:SAM-dependent methyltransferase [Actinomadura viridis]|uniref:SAM-dependent methyltransferase n=2 Tax=Actinomadura viridis TaxID=58110 RepID=A0A931GTL3_9ACTN|nr:SAM-dependent methyltransferase [Actinomadura viridis]
MLVPDAVFVHGDVTTVEFAPASFNAVVAMYALIHIPWEQQRALLERIVAWLRPGGWFLGTMGHRAWTGIDDDGSAGGGHVVEPHGRRRHQPALDHSVWSDRPG